MRKNTLPLLLAMIFLFSCNNNGEKTEASKTDSATATTEVKKETTMATMPDTAAIKKAWKVYMTPGDMHKWMAKTNGTWEAEVSQWMDPKAPPTKAKATNVQSSALGGRYVVGKFTSTMMGMPFEGMSTMGYDNAKKMFTSTWMDNMGTGIVHMSGSYDETTKTLNLKGHQTDFLTGNDSDIREEMTMIDNDSYSMTMYGTGMDGKEAKFMEGVFKRKK
ncbi:MAG: DUF1579 domain-containing protein [Ferruginibacter sp.]